MKIVFEQYGKYIIAVISSSVVIWAFTKLMGLWSNPYINGEGLSGTGLLGKLICLWLNRVM